MPKDHKEVISSAGCTELLRSPEETVEKRLEASLEVENRQEETVKPTDWSGEMEEEECGEAVKTIGMGTLVSISERRRGTILVSGTICVTGKAEIEIRNEIGESLWSKGILGEDYSQEVVKIKYDGWLWYQSVCWRDERGQHYGIFLEYKRKLRDQLFDCIIRVQKEDSQEDMGFGLFD